MIRVAVMVPRGAGMLIRYGSIMVVALPLKMMPIFATSAAVGIINIVPVLLLTAIRRPGFAINYVTKKPIRIHACRATGLGSAIHRCDGDGSRLSYGAN